MGNRSHRVRATLITPLCVYALACTGISAAPENPLLETHDSLGTPPQGSVELISGNYQSVILGTPCPFRVFSPVAPEWKTPEGEDRIASEGMRLVVYVMNLEGVPRPGTAADRAIMEGLIEDGFLVVAIDFKGGRIKDHLEWQKDINGLFCLFGGEWHTRQSYFTEHRKKLLGYPGPNEGKSFTSFPHPGDPSKPAIPVNRAGIYVIPSGYTVEAHLVFKEDVDGKDWGKNKRETLFMDVVYPKAARKDDRVPLLLEGSSTGTGEFVVNANTPILYSWLFNGYAFASMCYVNPNSGDKVKSQVLALRYLQSQNERFSLSGMIGTAGISKSCARCYSESNLREQEPDTGKKSPDHQPSRVRVCMPAVGGYPEEVWKNLGKDSPALVLSWCHLNNRNYDGGRHRAIRDAYRKAGIADECRYFSSPTAGHEYDLYHLNEIMAFFDKHCKEPAAGGGKHLFVLSGQSNMVGLDPDVSFTPAVTKTFGKENIIIVKNAHSGQSIRSWAKSNHEFPPPTRGRVPKVRGDLYDPLITNVNAAIKGETLKTVTFIWMQGESDLNNTAYDAYLKELLEQLQEDLAFKELNLVIGRISDNGLDVKKRLEGRLNIRRIQRDFAESHPRGAWVDTDDLNDRKEGDKVIHDLHYNAKGYRTLGTRFAEKAIELIKEENKGTGKSGT